MENLLKKIYENGKLTSFMKWGCRVCVLTSGAGFLLLSAVAFSESPLSLAKLLLILGVPFLLVSLLRRLINMKRPYEVYGFYEIPPKEKSGRSFPSRHAYSSFVISVSAVFLHPAVGIILLLFSLALCIFRVLLGIHFIRDVAAGGLIGVICSVIGFLILAPF